MMMKNDDDDVSAAIAQMREKYSWYNDDDGVSVDNKIPPKLKKHEIHSKTVTPLYTFDWYVKWISSIVLIAGMLCTANNLYPINLYFHMGGLAGWLAVAMIWNDRALIIINAIGLAIFANGLLQYYTSITVPVGY